MTVVVQTESFDLNNTLYQMKRNNSSIGAAVSFIGFVRDVVSKNETEELTSLFLEHYPGMTEKSLLAIENMARERWDLEDVFIVHRIGRLNLNDPIVGVIVLSKHRKNAFESCAFIMDYLKTEAPFWKKETTNQQSYWVDMIESDSIMKLKWEK